MEARVAALEREQAQIAANAEALILQAKGKFDAARSAEERARRLSESRASDPDEPEEIDLDELAQLYREAVLHAGDGGGGVEGAVQQVRTALEGPRPARNGAAVALKFNRRR